MLLNIMTWNTGITESKERFLEDIIKYIKVFLEKENSIAFLQQFPYKFKDNDNMWKASPQYNQLMEALPECDYTILANTSFNNGYIVMMTVSIAKKMQLSVKELNKGAYSEYFQSSRETAVSLFEEEKKEIGLDILGIHARARNKKENEEYLNNLNKVDVDMILGDFNAGNYKECENRSAFNRILKGYVCICNTVTRVSETGKRTCIDHVFVKDELVTKCGNLIVHEDVHFSDHFPISFTILLEE